MVTLRCRTPGEANLVRENLGSGDVLAVIPDEEEMWRQYERHGFVEVQISAAAYDADPELRSVVEFSTERVGHDHSTDPLGTTEKIFAALLGVVIVPGLLVFVGIQIRYEDKGYDRKARELKKWFVFGAASWLLIFLYCGIRF